MSPALLMPVAVAAAASGPGSPQQLLPVALGAALAVVVIVGGVSLWQVRTGRWAHVDASRPAERSRLNLLLVGLLWAAAALLSALVWPHMPGTLVVAALAVGVAWSRLVLRRHTLPEVLAGLLLGAAFGTGLHVVLG